MNKKFSALVLAIGLSSTALVAQNNTGVSISHTSGWANDAAALDINSDATNAPKGVLIPRITHTQMGTITPLDQETDGMQVFVNGGVDVAKRGYWLWDENEDKWIRFGIDIQLLMPSGAIMPFNSSTCPAGWDTEFTAARGRFIVGAGSNDGVLYNVGDEAGEEFVQLTKNTTPSHVHKIVGVMNAPGGVTTTSDQHTHDIYTRDGGTSVGAHRTTGDGGGRHRQLINWDPIHQEMEHEHDVSGTIIGYSDDGQTLAGQPHENRGPYLNVTYCIKN